MLKLSKKRAWLLLRLALLLSSKELAMRLTERETEKLLIFLAAELARKRQARGLIAAQGLVTFERPSL